MLNKSYYIYRNGVLYTRTLTEIKAWRIKRELEAKGFRSLIEHKEEGTAL